MTTEEATTEVFWTAFQALSPTERDAIFERLLNDQRFREDLIDLAIIEQRRNEPSRSLDEYLEERKEKGN